ncbi:MAG: SAM-dependent DNA methyltransferase [Spirochaetales bacterium]|nr:SAM-dependent DNA methyltransferase [Leptospiraceae bacterium]MCP5483066.1 SAM-dependent DNA methyltransferase [Spirochaetales bacterium]MCP5486126.1 SAM-dependent DNA methyltransferase [Spirochaetales bacterium]
MITGELRSKIDRLWEGMWTGGISNPLTVIEQITYLLFIKRLDDIHTAREKKANTLGKPQIEDPVFNKKQQHLRWSRFKDMEAAEMYKVMSTEVFPFMKNLHGNEDSGYARLMKDATFMIPTPHLLERTVSALSEIPMERRDTKGDLYEYLLSKIASAGQNGQFRTPRHIIRLMVDMLAPTPEDTVCDPAAGTFGFLIAFGEYLRDNHEGMFNDKKKLAHFNSDMFHAIEFDVTMLRIGVMNMLLHGVENPNIISKDALSEAASTVRDQFSVVLANPPFKGSLDYSTVAKDLLQTVKTKKTELLFLALFLNLLKVGGRCACIVPDGVLFGSSRAHVGIRKKLIDEHQLQAVVKMPSGVFKPYAGVSTAFLIFTKTNSGGTDQVWFYDMQADGFSLDDKRTPLDTSKHENNNLPDVLKRWQNLDGEKKRKRTDQSFFVPVDEIRQNNYDLSVNRYKEVVHDEIEYDPPKKIIADIQKMEAEIQKELNELAGMLK